MKSDPVERTRMTFGEHLEELRRRLRVGLLAVLVTFLAAFVFQEHIFKAAVWPHNQAMKMLGAQGASFIADKYPTAFMVQLKLALLAAILAASPVIGHQIWKFIGAGLYPKERRFVLLYLPASVLLFLGGCAFAFFVVCRYGLYFLAKYSERSGFAQLYRAGEYVNLVLMLTLLMGVVFQVPLLMMFFSRIGLIDPAAHRKRRKIAIVTIFVTAAVLTPPDIFTQVAMAVPLLLLYEGGIWLSVWAWRTHKAELDAPPAQPAPEPHG